MVPFHVNPANSIASPSACPKISHRANPLYSV
jgi:hypothetical protein